MPLVHAFVRLLAIALVAAVGCSRADPSREVSAFWDYFQAHASAIAEARGADDPAAQRLGAALRRVDPTLTFELGLGTPREFIVSADGISSAFPAVTRVVAAAPKNLPGWRVIAFRPRKDSPTLKMDGRTWSRDHVKFRVSRPAAKGMKLDIEVYPGVNENPVAVSTSGAVFVMLDSVLGEYDVETQLGKIEVRPGPAPPDALPLPRLAALVDARK